MSNKSKTRLSQGQAWSCDCFY